MQINIRGVEKGDLVPIQKLEQTIFKEQAFSARYFHYLFHMHRSGFFVLEVEQVLVGYCVVIVSSIEEVAELISIAVVPDLRRNKLGSLLLERCLQWTFEMELKKICLMVAVSNHPAQKMYQKHGFSCIKRVNHYYGHAKDAYYMCRNIAASSG